MHLGTHVLPDHDIRCYPCLAPVLPGSVQIRKVPFTGFAYSARDEHERGLHERRLTDVVAVQDASLGPSVPFSHRPMSWYALLAGP